MHIQQDKERARVVLIFVGTWLFASSLIAYGFLNDSANNEVFKRDVIGLMLILFPNLIPAGLLGYYLAPKLFVNKFGRTLGYQFLGGFIWVFIATIWLFIVLFRKEIVPDIFGVSSGKRMLVGFLNGLPIFGAAFSIPIIPSTLVASFLSSKYVKGTNAPSG